MRYLYDHGLPFSTKLAENLDDAYSRIKRNKASMIIIDGGVGEGKTTLGVLIADYFETKFGSGEKISLEIKDHPQLAMGGKEFAKQLRICFLAGKLIIIYDEGGDYSKRGAMTQFNAFLNRIFETYRAFKILVIICLPSMSVLDNTLFDNKIPRMILHCEDRGDNDGSFRGYSLRNAFFLRYHMKKLEDKSFAYRIVDPNFVGHFLNLDPERSAKLDKLTIAGKLDILQGAELKLEGLVDRRELANRLAKSPSWVALACAKLKIKPVRYVKKIAFYNKEIIDILQDFIMNGGTTTNKRMGDDL
jgi:hypothetical protein